MTFIVCFLSLVCSFRTGVIKNGRSGYPPSPKSHLPEPILDLCSIMVAIWLLFHMNESWVLPGHFNTTFTNFITASQTTWTFIEWNPFDKGIECHPHIQIHLGNVPNSWNEVMTFLTSITSLGNVCTVLPIEQISVETASMHREAEECLFHVYPTIFLKAPTSIKRRLHSTWIETGNEWDLWVIRSKWGSICRINRAGNALVSKTFEIMQCRQHGQGGSFNHGTLVAISSICLPMSQVKCSSFWSTNKNIPFQSNVNN